MSAARVGEICRGGRVGRRGERYTTGRKISIFTSNENSYNNPMIKGRPPRLPFIFQTYAPPLFFVTACTLHRRPIDDLAIAHQAFRKYGIKGAHDFDVAVGRYVIMPDHIHLFVRGSDSFNLGRWMNGLKRALSVASGTTNGHPLWQPGFFDHVLRNDENYDNKWEYVQTKSCSCRTC